MFNAYEFTFGGESSYQYDLMIYDFGGTKQNNVSFGNKAEISDDKTSGRIQPIHYGVNYHKTPLEFKLVFGSERALDRFELERVALWLTGHQDYQWMTIDQPDLHHVQFRCLVTQLTPLTHGWLPFAFEAVIKCDCPYAYGYPFEKRYPILGKTDILFRNDSSVREYLKPTLRIHSAIGASEFRIVNKSDSNREFVLTNLPSGEISIFVDNNEGIIRDETSGTNLYERFNLSFFRMVQGDNELEITGDGTLTIMGRFLYNVAG